MFDTSVFFRRAGRKLSLFSPVHRMPVHNSLSFPVYKLHDRNYPTFFGYYDKTPFSEDETKLLANVFTVKNDWKRSSGAFPLRVGYFDISHINSGSPVFRELGITHTWSWQQGCMLQWFPQDENRYMFYNCLSDKTYGSVIRDVITGETVRQFDAPLYALDPCGRYGLGLNFSRLERLRPGYGYSNERDKTEPAVCPDEDGIWSIDLESGSKKLLLSLRSIADMSPTADMRHSTHYVNHIMVSPDGERFIFLHVWLPDAGNPDFRFCRLMCYTLSGNDCFVVDDSAIVSHCTWLDNKEVLATRFLPSGTWQYVRYEFDGEREAVCYPVAGISLNKDGHPSLSPAGDKIATDMEDEFGELHLLLITTPGNTVYDLGGYYHPRRYFGMVRCDLHPRWDRSGKRICFDSAYEGRRAMYVACLEEKNNF